MKAIKSEKVNQSAQGATKFTKWRLANYLSNLPFHDVNFAWSNNRQGKHVVYERLDRL